ncbi:MAG: CDP-diacylglycerol--serine O-phosphatidyltransferase [Chlamydiae bacterium SM23_39]|nr:MAG: CDP-diacylglycerol--serine O-phosphatidyltransferase [Chlamydiae bacterium SM23_39]
MKRIYILPNFITAFGLACGLFVIFKASTMEPGNLKYDAIKTSVLFLIIAAFADFIDGAIARVFKAESEFGCIFDSLADAISFGVAPAVLFLKSLSLEQGTYLSFIAATGALIYSLCGVLRLARFTYLAQKAKEDDELSLSMKKNFTGLPIPGAAAGSVSINLFLLSPFSQFLNLSAEFKIILLSFLMILLGYFMVSRWKFPSFKALNFKIRSFHLAFFVVILTSFTLFGILHYFSIVLTILSWGYIILAITLSIIRIVAGKKSKTLEDFEPEPEEIEL